MKYWIAEYPGDKYSYELTTDATDGRVEIELDEAEAKRIQETDAQYYKDQRFLAKHFDKNWKPKR